LGFGSVGEDLLKAWFEENKWAVTKVSYTKGAKGGDKTTASEKEKQQKIWGWLMDMNNGDASGAGKHLTAITAFTNNEGKDIKGVMNVNKLTGTRLDIAYKNVKEAWIKSQPPEKEEK
jgi:hypothetical protein